MICRDVREALDALLDGELDSVEEGRVRVHLEDCAECGRDLEELRDWQRTLAGALSSEAPRPTAAERRRTVDALAAATHRRFPAPRVAAMLAIGLSVGIVSAAVGIGRPPEEQVVRVVERMTERARCDAQLRAVSEEIERDLGGARQAVAGRTAEDPAARAVEVASANIARHLDAGDAPPPASADVERVRVVRTTDGVTVAVVQMEDGRVRVDAPGGPIHARNMADLLSRHALVCRRYAIGGSDGYITVGDSGAGADWKGRLDLLRRTGAWDETLQWEAYRSWLAPRVRDARDLERKLRSAQERCRSAGESRATATASVDVDAILKNVKTLTRSELNRAQESVEAEMRRLESRLREAAELRARAKGLRIFAEDIGRD